MTTVGTEQQYWVVSKSGIHNYGLFAACDIPAGERVIEYLGRKISKEESSRLAAEWEMQAHPRGAGLVYTFELNDDFDLDGNIDYNPAKYANHHCDPNCESINDEESIWFIALRDIKEGEEISFDYGYGIDNFLDHPCLCGADSCTGYIVRQDQRWRLRHLLAGKLVKKKSVKKELVVG